MKTADFLNDYAAALLTYSAHEIATFYQVPLTVYSDEGVLQVTDMSEVVSFWLSGLEPYQKQGVVNTVPEIISEEQLSKTIRTCKVLWNNFNTSGKKAGSETNFYIIYYPKQKKD
jgi:hypothetical protein